MTEEATNGNPWAPDSPTLRSISQAAFEVDDYWRIVEILHKRLIRFEKKNWRASYNSLIVIEHLLTHGPESVAQEFQDDKNVINQMIGFQYVDETGFNWGLNVRKKADRILKLLEEGHVLKEERDRARRLSRGIQGFGSFCQRSSEQTSLRQESSSSASFFRSHSDVSSHENHNANSNGGQNDVAENQMLQKSETSTKENVAPNRDELHLWNLKGESNPLLDHSNEISRLDIFKGEDDHPFNSTEKHASVSLLSARGGIVQGC
ncbi:clathrin interactor EPSIN 1-like isoform X2 [Neltuma alba]|nr:clathrin interactor EPSIN 1-like isoform X2 [Prosopis alba]XP_028788375.1 clathrin interactor EPSIN 1-like isoform X2 [Prosopis alba]